MATDRKRGIGGELASLALIVACLASALASIMATYHRVNHAARVPPMVTPTPAVPTPPPPVGPPPSPVVAIPAPRLKRPRPAPAPPVVPSVNPEDPTAPVLARLTAAEAEQLLATSQSNRKAQALEDARRSAEVESERIRRRRSLIHAQIDSIETRVRQSERQLDALALERDALEKERDARKAAVARARSRPSQAILPHKGPNGTWRRPIVVECRNGGAVIQPQGLEFGLLDLEADLYGMANPFVSTVAREAARIQHQATPDGAPAVPYVFFLVRPDGIRPYYEARSRLESLGVTFGYELADQDWVVDFPDLDDVATWDGSPPSQPARSTLARSSSVGSGREGVTGSTAEDVDLPTWPRLRGAGANPADPFTFGGSGRGIGGGGMGGGGGGSALSRLQNAGRNPRAVGGTSTGSPTGTDLGTPPPGFPAELLPGGIIPADGLGARSSPAVGPNRDPGVGAGGGLGPGATRGEIASASPTRAQPGGPLGGGGLPPAPLAADASAAKPVSSPPLEHELVPSPGNRDVQPEVAAGPGAFVLPGPDPSPAGPTTNQATASDVLAAQGDPGDPTNPAHGFVFQGKPGQSRNRPSDGRNQPLPALPGPGLDDAPPPAGEGGGGSGSAVAETNPTGMGGERAARRQLGSTSPSGEPSTSPGQGGSPPPPPIGLGLPNQALTNAPPPSRPLPSPSSLPDLSRIDLSRIDPSKIPDLDKIPPIPPIPLPMNLPIPRHLPTPRQAGAAVERQFRAEVPAPPSRTAPVDRSFEIVVICGPDGVIVQPGNYRITPDALKDQEGLLKRQIVGLVKARRVADPTVPIEPKVRFLIQPRGVETYRAVRSQYFVSGLNWPTTTQIADPDPLVIRSRGVW